MCVFDTCVSETHMCLVKVSVLQHTATHCNALQHTHMGRAAAPSVRHRNAAGAAILFKECCCSVLQHTATHNALQRTATHYNALQRTTMRCNALQHTAAHCSTRQHTTTCYIVLQHTATNCNARQRFATHCNTHCNTYCNTLTRFTYRSPKCLRIAGRLALNSKLQNAVVTQCNTLQHTTTH